MQDCCRADEGDREFHEAGQLAAGAPSRSGRAATSDLAGCHLGESKPRPFRPARTGTGISNPLSRGAAADDPLPIQIGFQPIRRPTLQPKSPYSHGEANRFTAPVSRNATHA